MAQITVKYDPTFEIEKIEDWIPAGKPTLIISHNDLPCIFNFLNSTNL